MSLVHLVNRPAGLDPCLATVTDGDAVLLVGDGIYAASDSRLAAVAVPVAAVEEDAEARGVALPASVTAVGYDTFVALVVEHAASVSWG